MKFIVIEGLDGSGKSTQLKLLQNYLAEKNIKYKYLHFPRTDSPIFGELVSMFLRGDLGDLNNVNPYLVALIYAGDRDNAKEMISQWIKDDYLVIIDRYVYSNIAFQCAKIDDQNKRNDLMKWILGLEYNYYKIPQPEFSVFLDVPSSFTKKRLEENRNGEDREYLKGKQDIHEESLDFQSKVKNVYLTLTDREQTFEKIKCYNSDNEILSPKEIFNKILSAFKLDNI